MTLTVQEQSRERAKKKDGIRYKTGTGNMRPEARGQRPDPSPDPGNQSEARTDRISMCNLQKVEISAHLEHFEAKLYFFQKFILWLKMKLFCQLHFVMQSGNTLVSMLRPCSSIVGKFEMDNENGSRGVLQKTSSIKETLGYFTNIFIIYSKSKSVCPSVFRHCLCCSGGDFL